MDFRIEPEGSRSSLSIYSETYLQDGWLHLQCFENFLEYGLGAEVYAWETKTTKGDRASASYSLTTSGAKRGAVRLDVTVRSEPDGIVMDTSVTNLDEHIIEDIKYNTCLQCKHVPALRDGDGERTYVRTAEGWKAVAELPLRVAPGGARRMQNFFVAGHQPTDWQDGFMGRWGFSPTPLAEAFMAKQSSESPLAIGILWDRAFYARCNMNDSHHCIHSQGQIDDLCPGQTRARLGKIFFAPEGLDQLRAKAVAYFGG